jgi:hypothetical protein
MNCNNAIHNQGTMASGTVKENEMNSCANC